MTQSPVANPQLIIICDFLRGAPLEDIESYLQNLANRKQMSGLELFRASQNIVDASHILQLLVEKGSLSFSSRNNYYWKYRTWINRKKIKFNLLNFLEFLALEDFHRLHFFLKRLAKIKPVQNYQYVYSGLALSTCGAALAFYLKPEWWNAVVDTVMITAPSVGLWLIKYILIPQNLAALMVGYVCIQTLVNIYIILEKNSTSVEHKTNKIIRQVVNCLLIVSAQVLCFMALGIMTQSAATLFITAALFETLWTLREYCKLSKPTPLTEEERNSPLKCIQYEDKLAYFSRKEQQLMIAIIVLVLISIATTISVLFGSQFAFISLLSIVFQWLVSRYKDAAFENTEIQISQNLQATISNYFPPRSAQNDYNQIGGIKDILALEVEPVEKIAKIESLLQENIELPNGMQAFSNT